MIDVSDIRVADRARICGILIAAVTLGVYANSCAGPFIIDDLPGIVENPDIRHFGGWYGTIAVNLNSPISGRPLMWLTLALNYAAGELNVWGYHAFNVVLHLGSALLVFGVVRRTLLLERWGMLFDAGSEAGLAFAIALLWTVHPLLTESVVYVSQRTELLAGFFYLLTLYSSIRAWSSTRGQGWAAGAVLACAAGLLAKEQVATAPVAVLFYDFVFISGSFIRAIQRHFRLYLGLVSTWTIFFVLTAFGPRSGTVGFGLDVSATDYLRTQAGVLAHYLRLCFWPYPLCISYSDWPIVDTWSKSAAAGLFILFLLGLTGFGLWRRSWAGFAGAWCFLILGPSSSIVPITTEIAAERRMYLPLLGVITVVIGAAYGRLVRPELLVRRRKDVWSGVVVVMVLLLSTLVVLTIRRNRAFQTSTGVLSQTLAVRPTNELVRGALMETLAREDRLEVAHTLFVEGLRLKPDSPAMFYNWGEIMAMRGRQDEAMDAFRRIIAIDPQHHRAHRRLGFLLMQRGDAREAVEHLSAGLWEAPEYFAAYSNLGAALAAVGRTDDAVTSFRTAIRLNPYFADAYMNLGRILLEQGRLPEAVGLLEKAVDLAPDDDEARSALRQAHTLRGSGQ